ncbi:MAG: hypothetical protein CMH63_00760 [Nanoarchaeota archaeon]|jgi:hypothetical protein|nr:hypothetical protein [Nanoarchaeota archaeon]|tara:strand:- start:10399 stop:11460 length:1062 start_codon:yes stop_codon:yes gene_type:complete
MLKRLSFLVLMILFSVNVLAQEETVTFSGTIFEITIETGMNNNVVDLSSYFTSDNAIGYKYKQGKSGIEGLVIEIASDGKVNIEASNAGTRSVIFIGDDDITVAESNEVNVIISGDTQVSVSFSPDVETMELKEGESQTFAVSGDESVEWYVDDVLINHTESSYEFTGEEVKIYNIKAVAGESAKPWLVSVLSEEIVDPVTPLDPVPQGPECGNGIRETGENCGNCAADVKCSSNSRCEGGNCVLVKQTNLILYLGLLVGIIILAVVGVIFVRKKLLAKGGNKSLPTQQTRKPVQPVQKKPVSQPISAQLIPLVNYFKTNLSKYKIMDLKQQAMKQGWTKEQINKVLAWIKKK